MRKHFSHCLLCGRVIPEGNVYCELCRRNAESNPLDPDRELVKTVKEGLRRTDGYCPCRREKKGEYRCICEEFRKQMADPSFEGYCHCMLYYKSNEGDKENA